MVAPPVLFAGAGKATVRVWQDLITAEPGRLLRWVGKWVHSPAPWGCKKETLGGWVSAVTQKTLSFLAQLEEGSTVG